MRYADYNHLVNCHPGNWALDNCSQDNCHPDKCHLEQMPLRTRAPELSVFMAPAPELCFFYNMAPVVLC